MCLLWSFAVFGSLQNPDLIQTNRMWVRPFSSIYSDPHLLRGSLWPSSIKIWPVVSEKLLEDLALLGPAHGFREVFRIFSTIWLHLALPPKGPWGQTLCKYKSWSPSQVDHCDQVSSKSEEWFQRSQKHNCVRMKVDVNKSPKNAGLILQSSKDLFQVYIKTVPACNCMISFRNITPQAHSYDILSDHIVLATELVNQFLTR